MSNTINSLALNAHYFIIKVYKNKPRELIEVIKWVNLRIDIRMKYDWYFKYRAALLQIKYPKYTVETIFGYQPATGKTAEQLKLNLIKAKKAKITAYKNKLKKAEETWDSLFPISEDFFYKKAVEKINRLQFELNALLVTE
jgi:hypothetical protein